MRLITPHNVKLTSTTHHALNFTAQGGETFHIAAVGHTLFRVRYAPQGAPRLTRTWMISGDGDDVPHAGRSRDDLSPFFLPTCEVVNESAERVTLTTGALKLTVDYGEQFRLTWTTPDGQIFAQDVPRRAYTHDAHTGAIRHTLARREHEHYYGFGEVSGTLDKAGERVRLFPKDAIGYSARSSAPLYKHFPFYITFVPELNLFYGLLYDNTAETVFDMGQEINAALTPHRYYEAANGDVDYYLFMGDSMESVLRQFALLTGFPVLLPRYTLGYMASTMLYTERPDTQDQLLRFIALCREHDIPCDLFHMSSGYSTDSSGARQVFVWNHSKVPDPQALSAAFHEAGIRLSANIKPHLLTIHPRYDDVARAGAFVRDPDSPDAPLLNLCWRGGLEEFADGAFVDFTHPAGAEWWKTQCKTQLLSYGIDALWNDNNEFEIYNDDAICHGAGDPIHAGQARPLLTLLMARASYQALREHAPDHRPFVLTRSATVGAQRYAQTWSGDNVASWDTLRYNLPMGLGLSMSGMPHVGHDVGGFVGGRPSPELFVRWVQCNAFHPRFTIHSLAHDGEPNSPWMYPDILPIIRDTIRLRYRLIPYLYRLMFDAAASGRPIIRPLVYHFPQDITCRTESFDFMLGDALLIAPVLEPDTRERAVYLPQGADWYDFHTGAYYTGGQTIIAPAPLERIPVFVRAGAMIPMALIGESLRHTGDIDGGREVRVFPEKGDWVSTGGITEDDGHSMAYLRGEVTTIALTLLSEGEQIILTAFAEGGYSLPYDRLTFVFPPAETRQIVVEPSREIERHATPDGWQSITVQV